MKRFLLWLLALTAFAGCSRDATTDPGGPGNEGGKNAPYFYGYAMPEHPSHATRGVANKLKLWPTVMAQQNLTVKFLNGVPEYHQYVKEAAAEWEKAGGVKFHFVEAEEDAMIRVGFDYVRGMQTSWSYTGTDLLQLMDKQSEPTIHFAQWRRSSDAKKRSDVLRAFGQSLGLELEFRHPKKDPEWIRTPEGTLDEAAIRDYWEYELAEFITWEELKKMVLDPISVSPQFILQSESYDPESVMNWPFFEEIAYGLPTIRFDADFKTELSAGDKEFIRSIYGNPLSEVEPPHKIKYKYVPLIEFRCKGGALNFTVTTDKPLAVIWDREARDTVTYNLPEGATGYTPLQISHTYAGSKMRRVCIGEMVPVKELEGFSTTLQEFDFTGAAGADSMVFWGENRALEKIWIRGGGSDFIAQTFDFSGNKYLRELYLIGTLGSTVKVNDCANLEVLATTPTIYRPESVSGPATATGSGEIVHGDMMASGPSAKWPPVPQPDAESWPIVPLAEYSLGDLSGAGAEVGNCLRLRVVSLDNTRIKKIDFAANSGLEYIYLSSDFDYIAGGGGDPKGQYLLDAVRTLPSRLNKPQGLIVLRGIGVLLVPDPIPPRPLLPIHPEYPSIQPGEDFPTIPLKKKLDYVGILIDQSTLDGINAEITRKNWKIVWDSGLFIRK